jgi:transcriptional antiterminator NusG
MTDISTDSTEAIEDEATEAVVEPLVGTIEVNSERYEFEFEDDDEPAYVESPYDRPGRWYVVHTYSGYENKVRDNILRLIQNRELEEKIYEVVIPMEKVFDFKAGRKVEVEKKVFPGYLLVRSDLDDETWAAIRSTPGVTGFVGAGHSPTPLPRHEVEGILHVEVPGAEERPKRTRPQHLYAIEETVRVKEGPFADFTGQISEMSDDGIKLKVLVNIFGRETPVELDVSQVSKL